MTPYAELCVTSNFTFLSGASHPEELITRAAELGLSAIAITDRNSVAGVVRAFSALKELTRQRDEARSNAQTAQDCPMIRSQHVTDHSSRQIVPHFTGRTEAPTLPDMPLPRLIPGARLVLTDSPIEWLALPKDIAAWSRLTRLLSIGKRRAPKGACHLTRADLVEWGAGMVLIAALPDRTPLRSTHLHENASTASYINVRSAIGADPSGSVPARRLTPTTRRLLAQGPAQRRARRN